MKDTEFNQLLEGVVQADRIMSGKAKPARTTKFDSPQVKMIRDKTGLSQSQFARVVGVSKRTLENWEQGRRQPTGPARALLMIVDADPAHALKTLNS